MMFSATTVIAAFFVLASASPVTMRSTGAHALHLAKAESENIHDGKCVDVAGANYKNGTAVQIYSCNQSPAQTFIFDNTKNFQMRVSGNNDFCVDAGTNPKDGSKVHIWACHATGTPQQTWTTSSTGVVRLANTNLCLDVTDGNLSNGNQLQVYKCSGDSSVDISGNDNQKWVLGI
ncbi:ricin B lectin domain-containing protein [Flagelloscypha sp. PMI_526]|nr:ricin B lectin domain-containing protein [Flagelloscypha sp. PMI_526]